MATLLMIPRYTFPSASFHSIIAVFTFSNLAVNISEKWSFCALEHCRLEAVVGIVLIQIWLSSWHFDTRCGTNILEPFVQSNLVEWGLHQ
jgi:hypothetical protein